MGRPDLIRGVIDRLLPQSKIHAIDIKIFIRGFNSVQFDLIYKYVKSQGPRSNAMLCNLLAPGQSIFFKQLKCETRMYVLQLFEENYVSLNAVKISNT